jgi:hypothetical protein
MIYINQTGTTTITTNVNNNSRDVVSTYLLRFTHIMSQNVTEYTIDTTNPLEYGENDRYCEMVFNANFKYEGENSLEIYTNGTDLVYTGIVIVGQLIEDMTSYISDNEDGQNYIYIS